MTTYTPDWLREQAKDLRAAPERSKKEIDERRRAFVPTEDEPFCFPERPVVDAWATFTADDLDAIARAWSDSIEAAEALLKLWEEANNIADLEGYLMGHYDEPGQPLHAESYALGVLIREARHKFVSPAASIPQLKEQANAATD